MFQPSTNIYIGEVPFDNSYRHVRYFSDRTSQHNWFASRLTNSLNRSDYTYQRTDHAVCVPFNAETLYGYNYCMYQNANYGSRWFYCFITNVEYVNESTTRLYLETDMMQTWFPDLTVPACFVEREHVNNDAIGAHIKDEGISTGEMVCTYTAYDETSLYTIVSSAVEPLTDGTYVNVEGDIYANVSCGTALSAFDMTLPDQRGQFKRFMQALADNGQQDAVNAIYMVPATASPGFASKTNGYGVWVKGDNEPANEKTLSWNLGFTSLNGYTPKNNKCYCYPFEYAEVSNLQGANQQFALEFWDNKGTVTLKRTGGVDVNAGQVYIPLGYNGMDVFWEGAVNMPPYPTCSWVYQAYSNWLGQSKYDVPVTEGFPLDWMNVTSSGDASTLAMFKNLSGTLTKGDLGGAITGQYTVLAELSQQQRQPNTARGGTNSSVTLANIEGYKLAVRKYTVRAEIAEQIDDYFSMYGYNVSVLKKPNFTGRKSWNYVQCSGANVKGKAPAPVLSRINALLDSGVTFWHVDDIGNYELSNSIV